MSSNQKSIFRKLCSNPLSFMGMAYIAVVVLLGILAPFIAADKSENSNDIQLALAGLKPGSVQEYLQISNKTTRQSERIPLATWHEKGSLLFYKEWLGAEFESEEVSIERETETVNVRVLKRRHWLGTDRYGRDVLSRLMLGGKVSLAVGIMAVAISLTVGLLAGLFAGYFGGWVDKVIMFVVNVFWSIPTLLLVIAFSIALGKGFWQVFIAVGLSMWVEVARMTRGQILSLKNREFIDAARVFGFGHMRIMFGHLLPNLWSPLFVVLAANFASAILLEAGLSFLGLGVQPPAPSWGNMVYEHLGYLVTPRFYLALIPGLAIMFTVMSFNFIGNGLRDALDERMD